LIATSKSALPSPSPERDCLLPFLALQLRGEGEEGTEQYGPIIVSQFDQSCLLNQSAKFDQMAGAFAAVHDPLSFVGAAQTGFNAVRHCLGVFDRPERQLEFRD
jgi:hypothetical protein